jgi:hypothetical protein
MRRAHKNHRALLRHLPATPGMDFSEEELDQNGECPQKGIVNIFVHNGKLLALCIPLFGRHGGCLDHYCGASKEEGDDIRRSEDGIDIASYGCWWVAMRGLGGECDNDRGVTIVCSRHRWQCAHCSVGSLTVQAGRRAGGYRLCMGQHGVVNFAMVLHARLPSSAFSA